MLEDRYYMRNSQFGSRWSATTVLLIVNAVCFVAQSIVQVYTSFPLLEYFALSAPLLAKGYVWQLLTFQFLHGGLLHLLFNSLAIYMFGRAIEDSLGRVGFLKLYFLSGVLGGMLQALGGWIWASHVGLGPVVGASAGAFGLVAAFAALYPDRPLTMLIAFIIPVNMRAKYLLLVEALLALYGIIFIVRDGVAHAAHLGGILGGLAYIHLIVKGSLRSFSWPKLRPIARPRELVNVSPVKRSPWQRAKVVLADDLPAEEFISREVDPILDKISAHGIQSLTERERRILEAARAKMAER